MTVSPSTDEADYALSYALLRAILGINILFHGVSRILVGPAAFAQSLLPKFAHTPLPLWFVTAFALSLVWIEAVTGALVLFGAASRAAYTIGMLTIAALTFGSALSQDWEAVGLQLIYALIYAVLLATRSKNRYSIDALMKKTKADEIAR